MQEAMHDLCALSAKEQAFQTARVHGSVMLAEVTVSYNHLSQLSLLFAGRLFLFSLFACIFAKTIYIIYFPVLSIGFMFTFKYFLWS